MKIFGVGLNKTGTVSLHEALMILGYTSKHYQRPMELKDNLRLYDAMSDMPIINRYKQLHAMFSDAKFILTIREKESWHKSIDSYFANVYSGFSGMREEVYGTSVYNYDIYDKIYHFHNAGVIDHFSKFSPDSLLIMDICNGDGWEKLCPFLNKDIPDVEFPHANKQKYGDIHNSNNTLWSTLNA